MGSALINPVYRRLFAAQVVSLVGTGLATVALGLLAYRLNPGNAGAVLGTIFGIKMVAYVFVAPLAQAAVQRWSPKQVMIGADVIRVAVALGLPWVAADWQVYLLVFVLQAASATFTPTFQAVIPAVLPQEREYTAALSLSRLAYDLESVLSPVLTAALLLVVPSTGLFFGTAAGFLASGLLVLSCVVPPRRALTANTVREGPFGARVRHGYALFVREPALRPILALNLVVASVGGFILVQTVVIVRTVFGRGEDVVGLVLAAMGAGSIVMAVVLPALLGRWSDRRVMLGGAVLLSAAGLVIPWVLSVPTRMGLWAVAALWLLIGGLWAAVETPVGRILRRTVAEGDLADVFAAQFSLSHACWLLTYPLAGWLGGVSLSWTAVVLAGVASVATGVAVMLWPRAGAGGSGGSPSADQPQTRGTVVGG